MTDALLPPPTTRPTVFPRRISQYPHRPWRNPVRSLGSNTHGPLALHLPVGDYLLVIKMKWGVYGESDKGAVGEGTREGGGWYGGRELEEGRTGGDLWRRGKEEACAVGVLSMGTKDVKEKGEGGRWLKMRIIWGMGFWRLSTD